MGRAGRLREPTGHRLRPSGMRVPHRLVLLTASAALAALLTSCGDAGPSELTAEEASADPPTSRQVTVFVYTEDVPRPIAELPLVRETAWVPRSDGPDAPVVDAVEGLLLHEPAKGHDSVWHGRCAPGVEATGVTVEEQRITVRLRGFAPDEAGNATCDLSEPGWRAQRQQVAWTVRVATGRDLPVRVVLEDGYETIPPTRADESALLQPTEATASPTSTPAA